MARRKEVEQQTEELQAKVRALEEQVTALQGQLSNLQQQLSAREQEKRELQQQAEQYRAQAEQGSRQAEQYRAQVEQYRSRENAIVLAITDAREAGARRLAEAEGKAKDIIATAEEEARRTLADANRNARELEKKAKAVEYDANRRAEKLVENVQQDINKKFRQVEEDAAEFQLRLEKLNLSLSEAVNQARAQAESFARALTGILDDTDALGMEGKGLSALIDEKQAVTPEEYGSAAQFMQGMYKLQGRDIPPSFEEADEPAEAAVEDAYSLYEPVPRSQPEPAKYTAPEPPPFAAPEPPVYQPPEPPHYAAPQPPAYQQPPEPPQYNPLAPPAAEPQSTPEERVWTVDEIIAQQPPQQDKAQGGSEPDGIDLDSLLDEIMN